MTFKPFSKNFIPSHTLTEQLEALKARLDKQDKAHKDAWADTLPFDNEGLDEVESIRRESDDGLA
jgi:hypothetical protein